jgi:hypothetical protein
LITQALLLTLAGAVLLRVQSHFHGPRVGLVTCLLFIVLVLIPGTTGMESAFLVAALVALLFMAVNGRAFDGGSQVQQFLFGMVLGLAMLSRLDTVFLGAVICAACLAGVRAGAADRRRALVRLVLIFTGAAVVVAPYLAYNVVAFGHPVPISGVLKSSFPSPELSPHALESLSLLKIAAVLVAVAAAVLYLIWFAWTAPARQGADRPSARYDAAIALMAVAVLIHFPYSMLFMKWTEAWYFLSYGLFLALAVGPLVDRLVAGSGSRVRRLIYSAGTAGLILLGVATVAQRATRPLSASWNVTSYRAAVWARENTGKDEIFSMANAGHFGFFSERPVVNLDGLVGTFEFQEVLRRHELNEFLAELGVDYLVEHTFSDREDNDVLVEGGYGSLRLPFISFRYDTWADEVRVWERDEVYRSSPYWERGRETVLIIWRLRHDVTPPLEGEAYAAGDPSALGDLAPLH